MKYTPNYAGVAEILVGEPMKRAMVAHAEQIKAVAEAISPEETGRYKASFRINSGVMDIHGMRAYAEVENTAPYALHVEYGDGHTPRHRVLGRALGAA